MSGSVLPSHYRIRGLRLHIDIFTVFFFLTPVCQPSGWYLQHKPWPPPSIAVSQLRFTWSETSNVQIQRFIFRKSTFLLLSRGLHQFGIFYVLFVHYFRLVRVRSSLTIHIGFIYIVLYLRIYPVLLPEKFFVAWLSLWMYTQPCSCSTPLPQYLPYITFASGVEDKLLCPPFDALNFFSANDSINRTIDCHTTQPLISYSSVSDFFFDSISMHQSDATHTLTHPAPHAHVNSSPNLSSQLTSFCFFWTIHIHCGCF